MDLKYTKTLTVESGKAYDEVNVFLGGLSHSQKSIGKKMHYFLDKEKTQISDTVDTETIELMRKGRTMLVLNKNGKRNF